MYSKGSPPSLRITRRLRLALIASLFSAFITVLLLFDVVLSGHKPGLLHENAIFTLNLTTLGQRVHHLAPVILPNASSTTATTSRHEVTVLKREEDDGDAGEGQHRGNGREGDIIEGRAAENGANEAVSRLREKVGKNVETMEQVYKATSDAADSNDNTIAKGQDKVGHVAGKVDHAKDPTICNVGNTEDPVDNPHYKVAEAKQTAGTVTRDVGTTKDFVVATVDGSRIVVRDARPGVAATINGVVGTAKGLANTVQGTVETFGDVVRLARNTAEDVADGLGSTVEGATAAAGAVAEGAADTAKGVGNVVGNAANAAKRVGKVAGDAAAGAARVVSGLPSTVAKAAQAVKNLPKTIAQAVRTVRKLVKTSRVVIKTVKTVRETIAAIQPQLAQISAAIGTMRNETVGTVSTLRQEARVVGGALADVRRTLSSVRANATHDVGATYDRVGGIRAATADSTIAVRDGVSDMVDTAQAAGRTIANASRLLRGTVDMLGLADGGAAANGTFLDGVQAQAANVASSISESIRKATAIKNGFFGFAGETLDNLDLDGFYTFHVTTVCHGDYVDKMTGQLVATMPEKPPASDWQTRVNACVGNSDVHIMKSLQMCLIAVLVTTIIAMLLMTSAIVMPARQILVAGAKGMVMFNVIALFFATSTTTAISADGHSLVDRVPRLIGMHGEIGKSFVALTWTTIVFMCLTAAPLLAWPYYRQKLEAQQAGQEGEKAACEGEHSIGPPTLEPTGPYERTTGFSHRVSMV